MASLNKILLIGNLGADPEKRFTGNGTAVTTFSVATTARWNDKSGQKQERTEWHRIVVYGPQAESCAQYLSKGRPVFIEGEVRYRQFEGKDGNKRYITEINAQRVQFLRSAPGAAASGGAVGGTAKSRSSETDEAAFPAAPEENFSQGADEDIPF